MRLQRGLVILSVLALSVLLCGTSRADGVFEQYCCVCNQCETGASVRCATVDVGNVGGAGHCAQLCSQQDCSFQEVREGSCALAANATVCGLAPAPAASHPMLIALTAMLVAGGFVLSRRRARR